MLRRLLPPLALVLLNAGCSSLPPRESTQDYLLTRQAPEAQAFQVVDSRPPEDLRPANEPAGYRVDDRMLSPANAPVPPTPTNLAAGGVAIGLMGLAAMALDHLHGTREIRLEIAVEVEGRSFENTAWGTGQTTP